MQKRKIKLHYVVPALAALVVGLFMAIVPKHSTDAQTVLGCSGYYLSLDNTTAPPTTLISGDHTLGIYSSTSSSITGVVFNIDNFPLGRAVSGSSNSWNMPWHTQLATPAVSHRIDATVELSGGVFCLVPNFMTVIINNPAIVPFIATVTPTSFYAQTNEAINFTLKGAMGSTTSGTTTAIDVTPFTVFQKNAPPIGTLLETSGGFRFSAGTSPSTGNIIVTAYYGGSSRLINIPVTVYAQLTSGSGSTSSSGSSTTSGSSTSTSGTTTITPATSAASIESDPATKNCVVTAITQQRYDEIRLGTGSPVTAVEFEAINKCFADRNYVLPTSFLPVAPDKVKQLPQTSTIKIDGATNQIKKIGSESKTTLKFSGKAKPKSTVLLYVHSEPLVLSAQADKSGSWNYELEDPLESGKHEIYAVVDKGDGTYQRSSVFDFVIAKAEASPINPKGYNLKIESLTPTAAENNRTSNIYLFATGGLIILVLAVLMTILRITKKRHPAGAMAGSTDMATPVSSPLAETEAAAEPVPLPEAVIEPSLNVPEPPASESIAENPITPTPNTEEPSGSNPEERRNA